MEIKIVATTGKARGQAVEIRAVKFFIGRHDNCQLRPNIPSLAGIHALIEQRDNHVYLRDFGAEGGTGINDRVLHARETEVFDTDLVQIGPMVLTLSIKQKGTEQPLALHNAPDGWPFLEEPDESEDASQVNRKESGPNSASTVQPTTSLSKVETFLNTRPAAQPEKLSTASLAAMMQKAAPTAHPATVPASVPAKPLINRPVGRRALACEMVGEVLVVKILSPDLNEEETVSPVRYELRTLLEEEKVPNRMVIDMGNTQYLSSRAVGVLLAHYQGLDRKGASMRVCGVSKAIKPVLDQMRLSMLIDIYPTVEEAVQTPWE